MQSTFIQAKTVSLGKSVKLDDLKDVKIGALQKGSQLVYDDVEEQFISLPPNLSERTYGTTTQIPKLTIDSYGRISSIEEVSLFIGSTLGLIGDGGNQIEMPLDQFLKIKGGTGVTTAVQDDPNFAAEISIGQDVATTANVTFNTVTLSAVPTEDTDAATKKYVDDSSVDDISELNDTNGLLFDGDYNSLDNKPVIPAAQVNSDWTATSGVQKILNKPTIPVDINDLTDTDDLLTPYTAGNGILIDAYEEISINENVVATKTYVDDNVFSGSYNDLTDSITSGLGITIDVNNEISIGQDVATTANVTFNTVTLSTEPIANTDAATKKYVDDRILSVDDISELSDENNLLTPYTAGNGILIDAYEEISHADTSSEVTSTNTGRTYIQSIGLDDFGHVTSLGTATETVVDTNTYLTQAEFNTSDGVLTLTQNDTSTVTVDLDGRYAQANQILDKTSDVNFNTITIDDQHIFAENELFFGRRNISQHNIVLTDIANVFNSIYNLGGSNNIGSTAISSNGKYILAIRSDIANSGIVSQDYGSTFTLTSFSSGETQVFSGCAMSSDGKYQYVISRDNDRISKSTNYGLGFFPGSISVDGQTLSYEIANFICCSSSGKNVLFGTQTTDAGANQAKLFLSTDYASTFTEVYSLGATVGGFSHGEMSSDGKYITVTRSGPTAGVIRSEDGGLGWGPVATINSTGSWYGVAMSSDGKYQTIADCTLAGINTGYIYSSSNYGITFSQVGGNTGWAFPAMTADGRIQTCVSVTGTNNNQNEANISYNYGQTWSAVDDGLWSGGTPVVKLEMSANGKYTLANVTTGSILYKSIATEDIDGQLSIGEPISPNHATTKGYVDTKINSLATASVIIPLNVNVNSGFSNSGFTGSVPPVNSTPAQLNAQGFYNSVQNGPPTPISPYKIFGPNTNFRVNVYTKVINGTYDGLHVQLTKYVVETGAQLSLGVIDGGGSVVNETFTRQTGILNTGFSPETWYFNVYYGAYVGGNGATIQDTLVYLELA